MCFAVIAKHMRWGRQEDAHEFLRYVVDGMQKASLAGYKGLVDSLCNSSYNEK